MLIGLVGVERQAVGVAPLVACTVAKAGGQLDPASASPINFVVTFASAVSGFNGLGINYTGSTAGGAYLATVTGSGTTYNVAVTGMTTSGDVAITVNAGYTTPPNAISTSADNTVAWLGAGGGWQTLYSQTLTTSSDGWDGYTMRQVITPAAYNPGAPATASAIRVTVEASATSGLIADFVRAGHSAPTGDASDYDGTQVSMLFSGGVVCTVGAGALLLSDSASYSFDKTRSLVLSAHFPPGSSTGIKTADPGSAFEGNYKFTGNVDDTVTTDASGYGTIPTRLYAFSKVEVFTAGGPSLQTLAATRYAEADSFASHTVTLAATQALTAARYTVDDAFTTHTLSATGATQTLTAMRYTGDDAFPTHTVTPGVVGLSATRYTGDDAFPTSALSTTVGLSATRYTGDDAFATHTISVGASGAWYDLFSVTLNVDNAGWDGYVMRQKVDPSHYAGGVPATGTKLRVTIQAASTTGVDWYDIFVGHGTTTSGTGSDFDGTQVSATFPGSVTSIGAGVTLVSNDITYAFDKTKSIVASAGFVGATDVKSLASAASTLHGLWFIDNASHNSAGFDTPTSTPDHGNRVYLFSKIEVWG